MLASPVLEQQRKAGAALGEAFGWQLSKVYSSVAEEYEAATQGVGLVDRSYVGRLKVTGADSLDLLNRLSTNNLEELSVGRGTGTVFTSSKGRILDLLLVFMQDDGLLVFTGPENRQKIIEWIDFYTFAEDIEVQDVTEETAMLALLGPEAAHLLGELTGQDVSSLSRYEFTSTNLSGVDISAIRTDFASLPGYDLVMTASQAEQVWTELVEKGKEHQISPVGMETIEVIRVENGVPECGKELSEKINPLEANLLEFISFNKGCYIGQEVVTRLNTYKKVQKYLMGLSWESGDDPVPNADLTLEGKKIGWTTSAVRSLRLGKWIGLGYVRKAQAEPGVQLEMEYPGGTVSARVEALPFKV